MIIRVLAAACMLCACSRGDAPGDAAAPMRPSTLDNGSGDPTIAAKEGKPANPSARPPQHDRASATAPVDSPAASASSSARGKPDGTLTVAASGYTSGLRLEGERLLFCDKRGGRSLDLTSGVDTAHDRTCPKREERNSACEDVGMQVTVSTPGMAGYDVVDIPGSPPYRLQGRVADCAFATGLLAVVTGSEVVTIDVKTQKKSAVSQTGGDQVAVNGDWIGWSDGVKVYALHR